VCRLALVALLALASCGGGGGSHAPAGIVTVHNAAATLGSIVQVQLGPDFFYLDADPIGPGESRDIEWTPSDAGLWTFRALFDAPAERTTNGYLAPGGSADVTFTD
jgi:hypothetical protein